MDWNLPGGVNWSWLVGGLGNYALVMASVAGLCLTAPGLAVPGLGWRLRIGLAVMLGVVLSPVLGPQAVAPPEWPGTAWALFAELLTGGLLGMMAGMIVAGARSAGELVGAQVGTLDLDAVRPGIRRGADGDGPPLRLDGHGRVPGHGWPSRFGACPGRQLHRDPGRASRDSRPIRRVWCSAGSDTPWSWPFERPRRLRSPW